MDSIFNSISDSSIIKQIKFNNKQAKWDKKQVTSYQKLIKISKLKRRKLEKFISYYSISKPIFFNNGNNVYIQINFFWKPMFARGYYEIYQKDKNGKWVRIFQEMTWMS